MERDQSVIRVRNGERDIHCPTCGQRTPQAVMLVDRDGLFEVAQNGEIFSGQAFNIGSMWYGLREEAKS